MAEIERRSAPGLGLTRDVLFDRNTGCMSWDGSISSDGYAVQYRDGRQEVVHRVAYEACYGPIPEWTRLRRVCKSPQCVSPFHHVIRAPGSVVRRLNWPIEEMRGIGELLKGWSRRKPGFLLGCDPTRIQTFLLPSQTPNSVAAQLGVPAILVLAAYADLVLAAERQVRRRSAANTQA